MTPHQMVRLTELIEAEQQINERIAADESQNKSDAKHWIQPVARSALSRIVQCFDQGPRKAKLHPKQGDKPAVSDGEFSTIPSLEWVAIELEQKGSNKISYRITALGLPSGISTVSEFTIHPQKRNEEQVAKECSKFFPTGTISEFTSEEIVDDFLGHYGDYVKSLQPEQPIPPADSESA